MATKGVRIRGGQIQIKFKPPGDKKYSYVTLDGWTATPANVQKAAELREQIRLKCKYGTFRWSDYFPNDPRATSRSAGTFHHYAQSWVNNPQNGWTERTSYKWKGILNRIWMPYLSDRQIASISYSLISDTLASVIDEFQQEYNKTPSVSTYNDWLTCLRGTFNQAVKDGAILKHQNPCEQITNKTRPTPLPDPFDNVEANAIIDALYARESKEHAAYIEFCFYSGVRSPSEPTALLWNEISIRNQEARICRKRTRNGIEQGTKTGESRIIDLNSRTEHAINIMREISGFKKEWVFTQANQNPLINIEPLQLAWKRVLTHLKLRHRPMYNMRHSYASYYLTQGCSPGYLADQMGNSLKEFFRSYARWIEKSDKAKQSQIMRESTPFQEKKGLNGVK